VADVVLFMAGIEPENVASSRCAMAAGLFPDPPESDWEGMVAHILRRPNLTGRMSPLDGRPR
jgi:hypothetical protein